MRRPIKLPPEIPEMTREQRVAAFESERRILGPYVSKGMAGLRNRVEEIEEALANLRSRPESKAA